MSAARVPHRSARWAALCACLAALGPASLLRAGETPTAEAILGHMREVYASLGSYSDQGSIVREYSATSSDRHAFATLFTRKPRHFLLDFHKQGGDRYVIWGDPDAFHTWWKATGQVSDYPNPDNVNAFNLSDVPTAGLASKLPPLLYPKAPLPGVLTHFSDPTLEASESIGGQDCYRLAGHAFDVYGATGRQVNDRKLTLWIDTKSFLLRQLREERQAAAGAIDRTTTTYEPQANPVLTEHSMQFTPPNGH
jgi:hypothetical protein